MRDKKVREQNGFITILKELAMAAVTPVEVIMGCKAPGASMGAFLEVYFPYSFNQIICIPNISMGLNYPAIGSLRSRKSSSQFSESLAAKPSRICLKVGIY